MHHPAGRAHDVAPERFADALVAHAHPEKREIWPQLPDGLQRDAALDRATRPRGDKDAAGLEGADLVDGELVVLDDVQVDTEVAEVLFVVFFWVEGGLA